jgi:hypothetical protein
MPRVFSMSRTNAWRAVPPSEGVNASSELPCEWVPPEHYADIV